jgi:hypothetical protein
VTSTAPPDRRPTILQIHEAQRTLELSAAYHDNSVEQLKLLESVSILKRISNHHTGAFGHVKSTETQVELKDGTLVYVHWRDGQIVEVTGVVREITGEQKKQAREVVESLMAARTAAGLEAEPRYLEDQLARIKQAIIRKPPGRTAFDVIKDIQAIVGEIEEWLQVPRRVR